LKTIAFAGATLLVVPALLSFTIRAALVGRDRALEGSTQALSMIPGITGEFMRRAFLCRVLASCHPSVVIGFGTLFSKAASSIGENVVIGPRCHLGWVAIERDVLIGPDCHLPSGAHTHGTDDSDKPIREQAGAQVQVRVGAGAWIGSAAIVMADVGADTVIAAGSVVFQPIPESVVAGGVPARVLKRRHQPQAAAVQTRTHAS
jgi:virginiamycin A acetyltransferase